MSLNGGYRNGRAARCMRSHPTGVVATVMKDWFEGVSGALIGD